MGKTLQGYYDKAYDIHKTYPPMLKTRIVKTKHYRLNFRLRYKSLTYG